MLVFIFGFIMTGRIEASADYIFNSFESQMQVGTKQFENATIYWIEDDKQCRADVTEYTKITSSDDTIVKAWIERKNSYSKFVYLEAVNPGTATITIYFENETYQFDVTALGFEQGKISYCKEDITMKKGSVHDWGFNLSISWGNVSRALRKKDLVITSSNEKVVSVKYKYLSGDYLSDIELKAVGKGTATITIKVNTDEEKNKDLNGFTDSFKITVTEEPKCKTPKLLTQLASKNDVSADSIYCGFQIMQGDIEYELWVSPYKNKKFKKAAWAKTTFYETDHLIEYSHEDYYSEAETGDIKSMLITKYGKKKIKQNTKYYVKIRARYIDESHSNDWSKFSKVKEYWTAPAWIKQSKVKFNEYNGYVTFPKVKGTKGYVYITDSVEKEGYNIFGQPVYFRVTESRVTTQSGFAVENLKYNMKPENVFSVRPYAKHGKYYYIDGSKPIKSLAKFKYWDSDKYAGR